MFDLDIFIVLDSFVDVGLFEDDFVIVFSESDAVIVEVVIVYNFVSGVLYYNINGSEDGFGIGVEFVNLDNSLVLVVSNF